MVYSLGVHLSFVLFFCFFSLSLDTFFTYQLGLYLLYAMVSQGIGFCWGRAGILPLGNALFFGLSTYLSGMVLKNFDGIWILFVLLPLCATVPAFLALVIGRIIFDKLSTDGVFFSLITLALAMLSFLIANSWSSITGGFGGMLDIPSLGKLDNLDHLFFVIAPVSGLVTFLLYYLSRSPLGILLSALAQNKERICFFGFSTAMLQAIAYAISGLCAGIAGVLYAPHQGIVTPQAIGSLLSLDLVIWCALGGRQSTYGPILGTLLIGFLASRLRDELVYWEMIIALLFIFVVLFSPKGLAGLVELITKKIIPQSFFSLKNQFDQLRVACPKLQTKSFEKLTINDISVVIQGTKILDRFSLVMLNSGIYALVGPNGAGKTSVFNALTGVFSFQQGSVYLNDEEISSRRTELIARKGLARKFQTPSIFPNLSIQTNLLISLWAGRLELIKSLDRKALNWHNDRMDAVFKRFPFLKQKQFEAACLLSQGERQMLEFAMVVCSEPILMLLDEPCAGLSPDETQYMSESIAWFSKKLGCAVLMIEHDMKVVDQIADQIFVAHQGRVFFKGNMNEVQQSEAVKKIYMGVHK